jgi:multidrug transporter EmrE-like cation transporter
MFKGVSLIFIMLLLYLCFGEPITPMKMIGTGIIVVGIALYAKA